MKLICLEGPEKDTTWELSSSRTIIGRDPLCDIVISDRKSSKIHAEVVFEDGTFVFYDKASRNGSFINNFKEMRRQLVPGDRIRIGDTTIKVFDDPAPASIAWQQEDPFQTIEIPLDRLRSQVEDIVSAHQATHKKHPVYLTEEPVQTARLIKNLETVYEIGKAINSFQSLDELLDQLGQTLLDVFNEAQRLCILLKGNGTDFEPNLIKTRPDIPEEPFQICWSIVNKAVEQKTGILAKDASHDARFDASESAMAMSLRSLMCVPLVNKTAVLGVIYLDNCQKPDCFDENDVALLSAIANQSAVAIDNARLYHGIQKAHHEVILALMNTVEAKDPYTRGHSQRTSRYALGIARAMGLGTEECDKIKTAAELHDIGKIGVRDLIIGKDSPLSTMEFHSIQSHPLMGEKILGPIEYLNFTFPMIRYHHENYDGTGYPVGLKEEQIPLGARIIRLADAFDAMTTKRPYNDPVDFKEALEICKASRGKEFDPDVVDALVRFIGRNYQAPDDS